MPVTPAKLKQRRKAVTFDYEGDSVTVEYYPAALGGDTLDRARAWLEKAGAAATEAETEAVLLGFGEWFCAIVARWDYLEDDGETMQPLTPANIVAQMKTFADFIASVLLAVAQDRTAGNATGTPSSASSDATSSPVASSASTGESRTRSATSSSRAGSAAAARRSTGSASIPTGATG